MRPRVLLDCDEVLCFFIGGVLKLVHEHTGRLHTAEDVTRFDFAGVLGLDSVQSQAVKSAISRRPGWWRALEPIAGAREGLDKLRAVADVYIITSPWWTCETWLGDRLAWLDKHMGVPAHRVVMTGAKHLVRGDFLVDDKTETLREWRAEHPDGVAIQWETPHNRLDGWDGVSTCDWRTLVDLVSPAPIVSGPHALADFDDEQTGERFDTSDVETKR